METEKAQAERFSYKNKHFQSLECLVHRLQLHCDRLQHCIGSGKDYLPILQSEIRKFERFQRH